jgi:hypothetical protein
VSDGHVAIVVGGKCVCGGVGGGVAKIYFANKYLSLELLVARNLPTK